MFNKLILILALCAALPAQASYFNELSFPQNACLMGPSSGGSGPAKARVLVGPDLPNPGAASLGGVQSYTAVANQFLRSISTSGVVASAQPAFTDISGVATGAQLPNPSAVSLGGIQSIVASAHNWIDSISTSGVPHLSQPAFSDVSGSLAAGQLPAGVQPVAYLTKVAAYTALAGDVVGANATGGAFSITIPLAAANPNSIIRVKKLDVSANAVGLLASGGDLIDGSATQSLVDKNDSVELISDSVAAWNVF